VVEVAKRIGDDPCGREDGVVVDRHDHVSAGQTSGVVPAHGDAGIVLEADDTTAGNSCASISDVPSRDPSSSTSTSTEPSCSSAERTASRSSSCGRA